MLSFHRCFAISDNTQPSKTVYSDRLFCNRIFNFVIHTKCIFAQFLIRFVFVGLPFSICGSSSQSLHSLSLSLALLRNRLFLREFAIEILRSAYNTLIRQVRRVLERNSGGHDDSYLLWAIRFFMEFNRLSGFQLALVRYVLCICMQCICIQHCK